MSLLALAKKAQKINVEKLALDITKKNSGLVSKRIEGQLKVGESGDGGKIGLYKSIRYASFKSRIGSLAPSGTVDLKLSGNLYKGINTVVSANSYTTDSSVSYSNVQVDRYGKKIYELQKDNSEDIKFKNGVDTIAAYEKLLGL